MTQLKLALRTLVKTPFVTTVAALSLALGIGANTAIFSLFDQILLRRLPVEEPERLVNLGAPGPNPGAQSCNEAGGCDEIFSYPMFRDLEREQRSLVGLAAHRAFGANLAFRNQTRSAQGMLVSGSYFPVLAVQAALGRLLDPADDQTVGEHPVAVLSHAFWDTDVGRDPAVLNQTIVVNGHPLTVVGVAPPGFYGTTLGTVPDVFVPISMRGYMTPGWDGFDNRRAYWAYLFGRLGPGVSMEQAGQDLNRIYGSILNDVEAPLQAGMSEQTLERFLAKRITLDEGFRGQSDVHEEASTPLTLLFTITGVVLLIACANIANLLMARGARRNAEFAIRGALGAGRSQLLALLMSESILLAAFGGAASLVVAYWTLSFIAALLPVEAMTVVNLSIRPSILVFTAALSVGTGILFGLYPALQSTRADLVTVLKSNSGQPSGARSAARFRSALVTVQIALSMALLVAAGLFIKSLVNVSRVDLGLDIHNLVVFGVSPSLNGYTSDDTRALFERTEEELAAIPGVTGVSAALVPLLAGSNWGSSVRVEGFESGPDVDTNSRFNGVGPGYFSLMGIPIMAGREFTVGDAADAPRVAVVNETFARKFGLGGRESVGKWMSNRGGPGDELDLRIVGFVQDAKYSEVKGETPPLFFLPYRQDEDLGAINFYVRTGLEPGQIMPAVRGVMRRLDPNLPIENLKTMEQQVRENVFVDRMISTLAGGFALLATILAAVGLYGVLSFVVAQRTREIGLRMALGANREDVRGMVLMQVGRMFLVGGIVGILVALGIGTAAQSLLFGMEGNDPVVILGVSVLLAGVALTAGFLPALRASRVDPMKALRYE